MKNSSNASRRQFMIKSSLASAAMMLPGELLANQMLTEMNSKTDLKVFLFSKHLQFLDYKDMSEVTKEMGFDGLDLTVRPRGHVLPERVTEDLPRATEAMKAYGLSPLMFSSSVIEASNPIHAQVLKTASSLGYQYYRPAWVRYSDKTNILETVDKVRQQFSGLSSLNKELNLKASYHNHSGHYFGGPIWDLHAVLKELPKETMGCQYDIMHATVEGGKNWEIGFKLIQPYINTLVVKDFVWGKSNGKWDRVNVPMGTGMVNFKRYFSLLRQHNINVPISIHVEHDLGGAEHGNTPTIDRKTVFKRIKYDLDFLKKAWAESA